MRRIRRAAVLAALALLAAACEEGLPGRVPLVVRSTSGGMVDLTGTIWEGCRDDVTGSSRWREVHGEEGTVSYTISTYPVSGCAGDPTTYPYPALYAENVSDASVGWSPAAPAGLPDPVTASRVFVSGAAIGYDIYLLDDRDPAARVLYTGDPDRDLPRDRDGFPTRLEAGGLHEVKP